VTVLLLSLISGCSFVLVDEPCDTGTVLAEDTAQDERALWIDIAVGGVHTCALNEEGLASCWGSDGYGQSSPPQTVFSTLALGYAHSCGLDEAGAVHCWGRDQDGETSVSEGVFESLTAGGGHTCALSGLGDLTCWGRDTEGQSSPPDRIWQSVDAGWDHTCGVDMDGALECWGNVDALGDLPTGVFQTVTSGQGFGCALDTVAQAWCFGDFPDAVLDVPALAGLSAGLAHVCTVDGVGAVSCFGDDSAGQASPPEAAMHGLSAAPSAMHTCALEGAGTQPSPALCWGLNDVGQSRP
jgi:alpha-tubulin suppressor-like RCC1 family protein